MFRRRVPADVRARVGRSEIVRTLQTGSLAQARRRSRFLWTETEKLFAMLRENPSVTAGDVQKLLSLLNADCHWADQVALARHGHFFDHHGAPPAAADEIILETFADNYRAALARNDVSDVRDNVQRYAARLGLDVKLDSLNEKILGRAVLQALAGSCEASAARAKATRRLTEIETPEPVSKIAPESLPIEEVFEGEPTNHVPLNDNPGLAERPSRPILALTDAPVPPAVADGNARPNALQPLETLWKSFTDDLRSKKKWGKGYARQSLGTMRLWRQHQLGVNCASARRIQYRRRVTSMYSTDWVVELLAWIALERGKSFFNRDKRDAECFAHGRLEAQFEKRSKLLEPRQSRCEFC